MPPEAPADDGIIAPVSEVVLGLEESGGCPLAVEEEVTAAEGGAVRQGSHVR